MIEGFLIVENLFFNVNTEFVDAVLSEDSSNTILTCLRLLIRRYRENVPLDFEDWIVKYTEIRFYELFRMKKKTFFSLLDIIIENDEHKIITKKYRGGNNPVAPEKALLIFLYYVGQKDTVNTIGERFKVAKSTVMNLVNGFLYIINNKLKNKYIFWPITEEEVHYVTGGFKKYPGTIGAVDGTHIKVVVETAQHDSYVDRYMDHSINLMAVCNADRVFTYIFVGFPGSAHDSRVFNNSLLVRNIGRYGADKYFRDKEKYHLIGDSAFPIRRWLMTPYKKNQELNRLEKKHNYYLSSDRVVIEHIFGLLKGRWSRLKYIMTGSVCKAIEIVVAACVLHNFCIVNSDEWEGEIENNPEHIDEIYRENVGQEHQLGQQKRNRIARQLYENLI